jgi:hypothetical protein
MPVKVWSIFLEIRGGVIHTLRLTSSGLSRKCTQAIRDIVKGRLMVHIKLQGYSRGRLTSYKYSSERCKALVLVIQEVWFSSIHLTFNVDRCKFATSAIRGRA